MTSESTVEMKTSEAPNQLACLVTAVAHTEEQILITDRAGAIQYCNPAFERVTGYSRDEVYGENARILKSDRQSPEVYAELWSTLLAGNIWRGSLINRKKDGSCYAADSTISPILGASGETTGFVAIKRDITEHLRLERDLLEAQKLRTAALLAAGVAHDFNNLLTVINGYAELLLEISENSGPGVEYIEEIRTAGARAAILASQLMAVGPLAGRPGTESRCQ